MAFITIGSYYELGTSNYNDVSPPRVECYQGHTVSSGGDADVTLSAFGGISSSSQDFYLTEVKVTLANFTETCAYNLLYNGDTIATLGSPGINMRFEPGLQDDGTARTSTTQLLTLVMSCATATGTAAGLIAKGYLK